MIGTLAIVGVGLIGGSVGLATRSRGGAVRVLGVDQDAHTLARAEVLGAIDCAVSLKEAARLADVILFATPVNRIVEGVLEAAPHCKPDTILTDTGSTKADVVRAIEDKLPSQLHFVGGHPLAGSEKTGVEHARADLFAEKLAVLTPAGRTDPMALGIVRQLWVTLGAKVHELPPEEHDSALAWASHLPHFAAVAVAGLLPEKYRVFAASGFRDTTRIAAGDPELWAAIALQNRHALCIALNELILQIDRLYLAIDQDNHAQLVELLTAAKEVRDALGS